LFIPKSGGAAQQKLKKKKQKVIKVVKGASKSEENVNRDEMPAQLRVAAGFFDFILRITK
jgi:hypothetical protein